MAFANRYHILLKNILQGYKTIFIMKILSVIVPVYNVEIYLAKCLESLLKQDLSIDDYEIIVVNDGSTDNSLVISEKYSEKHSNLLVINQENKGLSGARNAGLKKAKGKYILFIDSDDYILENSLKLLIETIDKKKLDMLRFNYANVNEAYQVIPKKKNATYNISYSENILSGQDFLTEELGWACYAVQFLINRDFLLKNELHFRNGIYFEDVEWLVRALLIAKRVSSIDKEVYFYLQRQGSIVRSVDKTKQIKWYDDKLYIMSFLKEIGEKNHGRKINKWIDGFNALQVISLFVHVKTKLPEKKEEFIELLYKEKYIPLKSYRFTLKQLRDIYMINFSPRLFFSLKG